MTRVPTATQMLRSSKNRRRLEFIELRLFWEGRINRSDLVETFEISTPQATLDLREYQTHAPNNIVYDVRQRAYLAAPDFRPKLTVPDPERYLAQLSLWSGGIVERRETPIGTMPPCATLPALTRPVSETVLRHITRAIAGDSRLLIRYQPMKRDEISERWITPKHLADDGFRWHVRSYCHLRKDFRDFIISKIVEIRDEEPETEEIPRDVDWNTFVTVRIGPNPDLAEEQQQLIARDYGLNDGVREVHIRRSMLGYFLQRYYLMNWGDEARKPLAVLNQKDVQGALDHA